VDRLPDKGSTHLRSAGFRLIIHGLRLHPERTPEWVGFCQREVGRRGLDLQQLTRCSVPFSLRTLCPVTQRNLRSAGQMLPCAYRRSCKSCEKSVSRKRQLVEKVASILHESLKALVRSRGGKLATFSTGAPLILYRTPPVSKIQKDS